MLSNAAGGTITRTPLRPRTGGVHRAGELYLEGEAGTHLYRLFFQALAKAALPPDESRRITYLMERSWPLPSS
jgi:hypothetical protein